VDNAILGSHVGKHRQEFPIAMRTWSVGSTGKKGVGVTKRALEKSIPLNVGQLNRVFNGLWKTVCANSELGEIADLNFGKHFGIKSVRKVLLTVHVSAAFSSYRPCYTGKGRTRSRVDGHLPV